MKRLKRLNKKLYIIGTIIGFGSFIFIIIEKLIVNEDFYPITHSLWHMCIAIGAGLAALSMEDIYWERRRREGGEDTFYVNEKHSYFKIHNF
ncbi:MAG: hypothetical protein ACTSUE_13075 [Promethearchaeota archaeon]